MKLSRDTLALAGGEDRAATWAGDGINVQRLSPNPETVAFSSNHTVPNPSARLIDKAD